jgi:cell wall-associated NlpC family hydrolase
VSRAAAWALVAALALLTIMAPAAGSAPPAPPPASGTLLPGGAPAPDPRSRVQAVIERHLGRPYVWGSSGLKSFDCSGFVWRVMNDNGILIKRTTARKYFLTLPKVPDDERWSLGNIVFFSNLKHCGIVQTPETFYHAAVSVGTHASTFNAFWRSRISGVRAMPGLAARGAAEPPALSAPISRPR